jgi:hypothetical protein
MAWKALTEQRAIKPRTMFTIYDEPWGDGLSERSLSPSDKIAVDFLTTPGLWWKLSR